jgi:hypothetical protein
MGIDKISQFYADHDKMAADQRSLRMARFREALTSGNDLRWKVQRRLHFMRRTITHRLDRIHPGWIARFRSALRAAS